MTQNTLLINFLPKKCSNPGFSKFNLLIFLLFTSPSQYLWAILYPKSSFQQMPELSLTFLFFLIKLVPFGSSNIVIHVSSNDHFCAGFFSWAATSGCCLRKETRTKMANGLFPELIEFSCHHGWFHSLPDQLTNTGSFLPVCIPPKETLLFLWVFLNAALNLQFWTILFGQL